MSEEILSRLERIDHKEYSCGFEFADSSTFDEMARCFEERKILAKEIERLNKELEFEKLKNKEVREYIEEKLKYETINASTRRELLEILDKENKE